MSLPEKLPTSPPSMTAEFKSESQEELPSSSIRSSPIPCMSPLRTPPPLSPIEPPTPMSSITLHPSEYEIPDFMVRTLRWVHGVQQIPALLREAEALGYDDEYLVHARSVLAESTPRRLAVLKESCHTLIDMSLESQVLKKQIGYLQSDLERYQKRIQDAKENLYQFRRHNCKKEIKQLMDTGMSFEEAVQIVSARINASNADEKSPAAAPFVGSSGEPYEFRPIQPEPSTSAMFGFETNRRRTPVNLGPNRFGPYNVQFNGGTQLSNLERRTPVNSGPNGFGPYNIQYNGGTQFSNLEFSGPIGTSCEPYMRRVGATQGNEMPWSLQEPGGSNGIGMIGAGIKATGNGTPWRLQEPGGSNGIGMIGAGIKATGQTNEMFGSSKEQGNANGVKIKQETIRDIDLTSKEKDIRSIENEPSRSNGGGMVARYKTMLKADSDETIQEFGLQETVNEPGRSNEEDIKARCGTSKPGRPRRKRRVTSTKRRNKGQKRMRKI